MALAAVVLVDQVGLARVPPVIETDGELVPVSMLVDPFLVAMEDV